MVDTALGRLGVQTRGSREAMMFWPSLLMTGDMWAAQAEHFADRCRVTLVDPPGHGRSQKLAAMFAFVDCARSIVDMLDGLGVERTHFVGNSWGPHPPQGPGRNSSTDSCCGWPSRRAESGRR